MPRSEQRRPGRGGAADTSLAGDSPQITKPSPEFQAAIERTSELDRAWFRLHPERAHRVRRATALERQNDRPLGCSFFIVVKQVVPGLRMRAGFWGHPRTLRLRELRRRSVGEVRAREVSGHGRRGCRDPAEARYMTALASDSTTVLRRRRGARS